MDYADVPDFVASLREVESVAARALEFCILTAARTGEVRFAKWSEIDGEAKVWTVPAKRTKTNIKHRVPLSGRAIEILEGLAEYRRTGHARTRSAGRHGPRLPQQLPRLVRK
jgi:integrase